MKIYHHNDMDGYTSASIIMETIYRKYNIDKEKLKLFCVNYELDVLDKFNKAHDEIVFIVDYSITESTKYLLLTLLDNNCSIIWIDHHQSSIDFINENPDIKDRISSNNIYGLFSTKYSGALLCLLFTKLMDYKITIEDNKESISVINSNHDNDIIDKVIPSLMNSYYYAFLVSDYDTWALKNPDSKYFKLGYDSILEEDKFKVLKNLYNNALNESQLNTLYVDTAIEDDELTNAVELNGISTYNLISKGKAIDNYIIANNQFHFNNYSYEAIFEGQKIIVMNRIGNSLLFGDAIKSYPFCMTWCYNGKEYIYSLYSDNETGADVKAIAVKFGGGGHTHAAGFRLKDFVLMNK